MGDTNTSPRIRNEVKITQTQTYKYTMKITGLIASTMLLLMASAPSGLLASPDGQPSIVPVADLADIGLGVQKIFNPTNGQVNSNDVRGLANTLQKYLPFPFLATGRQGSRGGGSSRKPTGGKPTGGKPTGRTPTQGGGGEGEEGR